MKAKLDKIKWEIIITAIISLTSVFVAIKAYNISKMQAEIAKNSMLPSFNIDEKIEESDGFGWKESSIIEISNLSGKMNNYQAEVITFLHCGYFGSELADFEIVDIPIESYYILGVKYGTTNGIIEEKETLGNYDKVKKLEEAILQFNRENQNGQNISAQVQTYLKITYLDLLNENQEIYYLIDPIAAKMISVESGQFQFDKYSKLTESKFAISPNRFDEISVNEVVDVIEGILSSDYKNLVEQNINVMEESKLNILNEPIMTTIVGAIIGIAATIFGGWIMYAREKRSQESFAATILYNDLRSIEKYLACERSSVNLRYSSDWQQIVANCSFLKEEEIEWIYTIYDEVYNYNYRYRLKEQMGNFRKEDIDSYKTLQKNLFDTSKGYTDLKTYSETYDKLIKNLQEHKKH